jgi:regulator of sigma E protease
MSWLLTIFGIMALIVLHELGHFAVAKAVGMRVERFSLFFPPKLLGVKRGETEYMLGAIPAGGYVKITGMSPEEVEQLPAAVARRAYYTQAPWKRIAVILAGPGVNLLIAFVLFAAVLLAGNLDGVVTLTNLNPKLHALAPTATVAEVRPRSPASGALLAGDRIVAVDGLHPVGVEAARAAIESHRCNGASTNGCRSATPVALTVQRGARRLTVRAYPRYDQTAQRMLLGFAFGARPLPLSVPSAARASLSSMWATTEETLTSLAKALTSSKERKQVSSIVGITEVTHQAVASGAGKALVVVGFVSLVLGVVNLFPFLPLDGGHVLWSVAEKLRGRRVSVAAMWRFSSIGIVLLLFLVINGFSNDISRLAG